MTCSPLAIARFRSPCWHRHQRRRRARLRSAVRGGRVPLNHPKVLLFLKGHHSFLRKQVMTRWVCKCGHSNPPQNSFCKCGLRWDKTPPLTAFNAGKLQGAPASRQPKTETRPAKNQNRQPEKAPKPNPSTDQAPALKLPVEPKTVSPTPMEKAGPPDVWPFLQLPVSQSVSASCLSGPVSVQPPSQLPKQVSPEMQALLGHYAQAQQPLPPELLSLVQPVPVSKSLQSQMHSDANKIGKLEKRAKRLEDIIQQSHQAWSTYVQQIRAKFLQDQKSYQEVVQQAQMDLQQVQSELQQQKLHTYQSLSQTLVPGPCFSAAASLQSGMEVDAEPLLPWMSPGVLDFPSGPPPSMDSLSGVPAVAGLQVPVSQPAKDSAQPPFLHHSFHVTPGLQSEPAGFPCAATPPAANPMFANGLSQVAASHGGLPCGGFPCGGLPCVPGPSAFPFVSAAVSQAPPVTVPSAPVAQEASTESAPKRLPRDSKHGSNFHTAVSASASFGFRWRNIYAVAAGWIHGCTGHQSGATCNGYASFTCCPCFAPTSPASTCPWLRAMPSCERSRVAIFGKPGSGSEGYAATRYGVVQAVSIIPASRSPRFCRCPCASFVPCVCEPSRRNTGSRCSVHFQFSGKACVPASEIAQSEQGLRGFCAYPARGSFSRAWRNGHPARHTITSPDAGADRNSFAARGGFDSFGIAAGPGEAPSGGVSETVCASTLDFVEGVCPGTVRRPCVGLSPCSHVLPASKPRALSLSELLQPVGFEQSKLWSLHDCVRSCMQPWGVPFLRQDRELFHLLPDLSRDLLVLIEQVPTWNQEPVIKAFVYTDGSSACSQPATWAMVVVYQCSDVGSGCCCWRFRGFAFATVTQHEQWIRRGPNVGEQIHDALTAEAVGLIWAMVWSLQCDEFLDCCFCFDAQSVGFHAAGFWSWTSSMYYDQLSASLSALRALLHTVKSSVCWMHEPAHAGHPWNELCDALAKACCKGVLFPLVLPLELPNLVRHSYCAHAWLTLADRRHDLPTPAAWPALFRLEGPLPLPYRMPPGILRPRHLVLSLKSVLL